MENRRKECHRFWLRLRHAVTLILNVQTSASKKKNDADLSSNCMTNAFERTEDQFYGFPHLSGNIGNKEYHITRHAYVLSVNSKRSHHKRYPPRPPSPGQNFWSNLRRPGFPGSHNFNKLYTFHHFQDLDH